MKSVSLIIFAAALISSSVVAGTLPKIDGDYSVTSSSGLYCPPSIEVKVTESSISIYGGMIAEGYERSYANINKKTQKVPDSENTAYEERTTLEQNVLKTEAKHCRGFIFKTCGKWALKHTLKIVDEKTVEIFTSETAPSSDSAGFPIAELCRYTRP